MNRSRSEVVPSDSLRLSCEPLGRVNLLALRRGLTFVVLGGALVSTLVLAAQGRLAASIRPALITADLGPSHSPLDEMVGADARLFTRTTPGR